MDSAPCLWVRCVLGFWNYCGKRPYRKATAHFADGEIGQKGFSDLLRVSQRHSYNWKRESPRSEYSTSLGFWKSASTAFTTVGQFSGDILISIFLHYGHARQEGTSFNDAVMFYCVPWGAFHLCSWGHIGFKLSEIASQVFSLFRTQQTGPSLTNTTLLHNGDWVRCFSKVILSLFILTNVWMTHPSIPQQRTKSHCRGLQGCGRWGKVLAR